MRLFGKRQENGNEAQTVQNIVAGTVYLNQYSPSPPPPYEQEAYSQQQTPTGPDTATAPGKKKRMKWSSKSTLTDQEDVATTPMDDCMDQNAALYDSISVQLNNIITYIDGNQAGSEDDLNAQLTSDPYYATTPPLLASPPVARNVQISKSTPFKPLPREDYFSKVYSYANARLPPHLLPFKAYIETWRHICLAAQYAERAYTRPNSAERDTHIDANWRQGTKAMVLKSVPIDDMNTLVLAIRGTHSFYDWTVNFRREPSSPSGFLDDPGNLCHSGFLSVARSMIGPIAARLRQLLEQDPSRTGWSLLLTGHSAGGAVASLLYAHMLAETVDSELQTLTGCFRRVHCITFGAPPVSLLPLQKPRGERYRKSMFYAFVNQGDPVARAEMEYVKGLVKLCVMPVPQGRTLVGPSTSPPDESSYSSLALPDQMAGKPSKRPGNPRKFGTKKSSLTVSAPLPVWRVPPATLSNAGRLVLLREKPTSTGTVVEESVEACVVEDEDLRKVVFGDPGMHMMRVYARRVEVLATLAVTGRTED